MTRIDWTLIRHYLKLGRRQKALENRVELVMSDQTAATLLVAHVAFLDSLTVENHIHATQEHRPYRNYRQEFTTFYLNGQGNSFEHGPDCEGCGGRPGGTTGMEP